MTRLVLYRARSIDAYDGGPGRVAGTVTVAGMPAVRRVRLFDRISGRLLRETWSDEAGAYQFDNVALDRAYTVVSLDHTLVNNAVIADNVFAEVPA
jgi:hypothetical protein